MKKKTNIATKISIRTFWKCVQNCNISSRTIRRVGHDSSNIYVICIHTAFHISSSKQATLHHSIFFIKYPSYAFCLCECVCSLWQLLTICALCDVLQLPFFPFLSDLFMLLLLFSMQTTQKTQQFKLHRIVNEHLLLLLKFFFFFFPFATFVVFICRIENFPTRWMQFVTTHTLMIVV